MSAPITCTRSRPRPSTSCARSRPSSSGPCCCSPAARTRSCCCGWPRRRSAPARFPFPVLHVDTGHNFPEVLEFRDRRVEELGERLIVASVQDSIDAGRVREEGPVQARHVAQPAADRDAARRDRARTASTPRSAARAATRSARGRRSGSSPSATTSASGTRAPSAPSCGTSTTAASARGEHVRVFPLSNWTELDVWHYIAAGGARAAVDLLRARARGVRARRDAATPVSEYVEPPTTARSRPSSVRYRTVGDMTITGAVRSTRADVDDGDRRDRGHARHRARRDARRRPHLGGRDGGPQARGLLLDDATRVAAAAPRHRRLGRRRQVDPDRPAAATTPSCSSTTRSTRCTERRDGAPDLAPLTDGLRAEREQGITIDVAYRYFATPRRSFIIADTPGPRALHAQHGHRRLDRRPRGDPGRRAPRDRRAVAPPRLRSSSLLGIRHLVAARQQDGPRRLGRGALPRDRGRVRARWPAQLGVARRARRPDLRAATATTSSSAGGARPGTTGRRCSSTSRRSTSRADRGRGTAAAARPVGDPPARRPRGERRYAGQLAGGTLRAGDEVVVLPAGARTTVARGRDARRAASSAAAPPTRSRVAARRRPRRRPRRHALRRRTSRRPSAARARGDGLLDGRAPLRAGRHATRSSTRRAPCARPSRRSTRCST